MSRKKKMWIIAVAVITCICLGIAGLALFGRFQMGKIPGLTFEEALAYTTRGNNDAVITVGVVRGRDTSYTVYGKDGMELPHSAHTYEIGSITKTFTAGLIYGVLDIDATLDQVLSLPEGVDYPTIRDLLTHTSGYRNFYFEKPMIANFLAGRNDFYGIPELMLVDRLANVQVENKEHAFLYSNFGYAVLGLVIEEIYKEDYTLLMNTFLRDRCMFINTKISDQSGDLGHYWDWEVGDAYLPAGGLTSNISDMLTYAQSYLYGEPIQGERVIDASSERLKAMGIHMDEIGMGWMIDRENGFIWHNGATSHYNCYIGFCQDTQTAVVVLSNLAPDERIPATVLGVKLLKSLQ